MSSPHIVEKTVEYLVTGYLCARYHKRYEPFVIVELLKSLLFYSSFSYLCSKPSSTARGSNNQSVSVVAKACCEQDDPCRT
jgi:hypothetical protein